MIARLAAAMPSALFLSMCSGCDDRYAVEGQGQPEGCEMQGDNSYRCPSCRAAEPPVTVVPGVKSYRLRDGWQGSRWVVLAAPVDGWCDIRRVGFPDSLPVRMPVTELCGEMP